MLGDSLKAPPGFLRPTKSAPSSPAKPLGMLRTRSESFHAIHKVPVGDSPYVRAKNVQLVEKDPERAIPLFWAAINAGDRVDSALKDMAIVMKQQNRTEEAIEAIKSLRHRCSDQAQESLDNILLDLFKRCGRLDDQVILLKRKLLLIQKGLAFNGKRTKTARSQGKKFQVSVEQEATRLLGNLGWALMQKENYKEAEDAYRQALLIAPDSNKMCNLGICLMKQGRISQAKDTLRLVKPAVADGPRGADSHLKAYERAQQMLHDLQQSELMNRGGDDATEQRRVFESLFGWSSVWQPQPCKDQNTTIKLNNQSYGDENVNSNLVQRPPAQRSLKQVMGDSVWQSQPCRDQNPVIELNNMRYGDENLISNLVPPHPVQRSLKQGMGDSDNRQNRLNIDAQPFMSSKFMKDPVLKETTNPHHHSQALERLKRTRSLNTSNGLSDVERQETKLRRSGGRLSDSDGELGLPDDKDFENAILAAVLGPANGTEGSSNLLVKREAAVEKRLKVFQDITLCLTPRSLPRSNLV